MNNEDDYTLFKGMVKGAKPMFAMIKTSLIEQPLQKEFPYSVFIELYPENDEYPIGDEGILFERIEDELVLNFENENTVFVGHVTTPNKREVIFYTNSPRSLKKGLKTWKKNLSINTSIAIRKDKKWEDIGGFLNQRQ